MTEHLSTGIVERFQRQTLNPGDKSQLYDHVAECDGCRRRIVDSRGGEAVALQSLLEQLLPDDLDEPYHLDFEAIEGYVDDTLDRVDRDTAEMHLEVCSECSAEVIDLRKSLAMMKAASLPPRKLTAKSSSQAAIRSFPDLFRRLYPFRIPAIAALIILSIAAAVVVWRMRSPQQQAQRNSNAPNKQSVAQASSPTPIQIPTPNVANAGSTPTIPSPIVGAKPKRLTDAVPGSNRVKPLIVLNDGAGRVTLTNSGDVTGLFDISSEDRQAVKDALLAEAIRRPEILSDLTGREGVLRGSSGGETIKLLYPGNTVIVEDRPLFKWLPLKDATGYRVTVGDSNFHGAAKSGDLPSTITEWRPPTPLKRGMVYDWIVTAVKDGVEISSTSSNPEMKFKVLDADKIALLDHLKTRSQSHLALGVFYAREGMLVEAKQEFQALAQENPRSSIALKLLREVRSWSKR